MENNKNNNKPENFENQKSLGLENEDKQLTDGQYRDNLKTRKNKDYNEPL